MKKNLTILEYIIFSSLILFALLYLIDSHVIHLWDESRNAINALEMKENNNFLVRHFSNKPDMWEVKPPFLIWIQVLFFKIFGINEFAMRLPSIISTFLLIINLALLFRNYFNAKYIGFGVGLIIVTSFGYMDRHIARTGDHDATLVFFVYMFIISFFKWLNDNRVCDLYLSIIFLLFATLTKSIVSLMFLPGLFLYILYKKQILNVLKEKHFYFAILGYIILVAGYYLLRESQNPGYLKTVWNEELFPRYSNTKVGSEYYINNFISNRFKPWIYILPISIIFSVIKAKGRLKDFLIILLLCSTIFFVVISKGSKNLWYDALLYPAFAIFIATSFYLLYELISSYKFKKIAYLVPIIFISIFAFNYKKIIHNYQQNDIAKPQLDAYGISYILRDYIHNNIIDEQFTVLYEDYYAHIKFYFKLYKLKNPNVRFSNYLKLINENETVIVCQDRLKKRIENEFHVEKQDMGYNTIKYKILEKKL